MKIEPNNIYQGDCIEIMKLLPDESIDVILTDPPYLYLKNQKLDRPFDEAEYFNQAKRILKKDGFIVLFGRGTSFYRWNTIIADLGFTFKEEIIWDKSYTTSSMHPISRCHETIVIWGINSGINSPRIDYIEAKYGNYESMHNDLKRIKSALNNPKELAAMTSYLEKRIVEYGDDKKRGYNTTIQGVSKEQPRSVKTLQCITEGMKEKSIIRVKREHYNTIHPTQKPARLLERLLALTSKEGDLILDTFAGSCNMAKACINTCRNYICMEIDEEYYNAGAENVKVYKVQLQPDLFTNTIQA